MTYLDRLAHEIELKVPPELMPAEDVRPLFRLYAVLALAKGPEVSARDVHDAWSAWTLGRDPEHTSIKPFEELDHETQAADLPFVAAIRAVAEHLDRSHT